MPAFFLFSAASIAACDRPIDKDIDSGLSATGHGRRAAAEKIFQQMNGIAGFGPVVTTGRHGDDT
jgi:hypothetical protein